MNKFRSTALVCLLSAGASFAGLVLAQEDAAKESMQKANDVVEKGQQALKKGQDVMQQAEQAMQTGAMPSMSPEQQAEMEAWQKAGTPGTQQQRLIDGAVGTWSAKTSMWMDPDAEPMVSTGTSVNTAVLGGRYVRMDYTGQMMGEEFQGVGYIGYDNVKGKYFASWIDSMSTGMYVANGEYDPDTRTYTYHGTMPNPLDPGTKVDIRQTLHMIDADHHTMEWFEVHDGSERKTMQIEYSRVE